MHKEETEKKFEEYRASLVFEAQRLVSYIRLYCHLHERMQDRRSEMNIARGFFQVTLDALLAGIVLWVDKLFSRKSERGFCNFLSFIENNHRMFNISELQRRKNYPNSHWILNRPLITFETIQEDRRKIEKIESLPSFKLRRDRFYAHFDKKYFFNKTKLTEDGPLKWKDLEQIINVMADILDEYSTSYDGQHYPLEPINIKDVDHLLDFLHKHYYK